MRVHCRDLTAQFIDGVYLDGVIIDRVIIADEEKGLVERYSERGADRFATETLAGKVVIKFKAPSSGPLFPELAAERATKPDRSGEA